MTAPLQRHDSPGDDVRRFIDHGSDLHARLRVHAYTHIEMDRGADAAWLGQQKPDYLIQTPLCARCKQHTVGAGLERVQSMRCRAHEPLGEAPG